MCWFTEIREICRQRRPAKYRGGPYDGVFHGAEGGPTGRGRLTPACEFPAASTRSASARTMRSRVKPRNAHRARGTPALRASTRTTAVLRRRRATTTLVAMIGKAAGEFLGRAMLSRRNSVMNGASPIFAVDPLVQKRAYGAKFIEEKRDSEFMAVHATGMIRQHSEQQSGALEASTTFSFVPVPRFGNGCRKCVARIRRTVAKKRPPMSFRVWYGRRAIVTSPSRCEWTGIWFTRPNRILGVPSKSVCASPRQDPGCDRSCPDLCKRGGPEDHVQADAMHEILRHLKQPAHPVCRRTGYSDRTGIGGNWNAAH